MRKNWKEGRHLTFGDRLTLTLRSKSVLEDDIRVILYRDAKSDWVADSQSLLWNKRFVEDGDASEEEAMESAEKKVKNFLKDMASYYTSMLENFDEPKEKCEESERDER